MSNITISGCKGCAVNAEYERCRIDPINKSGIQCPCRECLVKGMCNTSCKLYQQFRGYVGYNE